MKSYFDTSVIFPALTSSYPHHIKCLEIFESALEKGKVVCLSMHVYAELYANITRFPLGKRISPATAAKAIISLKDVVSTIDLTQSDYEAAMLRCAEQELISGVIYDALHLQAAIKAQVDVLYTANLKDFQRLYTNDLCFRLEGV